MIALRQLAAGDTVGYGATWTAQGPARIAVLAAGYADGYPRALGRASAPEKGGMPQEKGGQAHIAGYTVPVAGRVSMDMLALDVSTVPEGAIRRGDMAELIGPNISVDEVGRRAQTIGYEILTSLGRRYMRRYVSDAGGASQEPGGQV